RVAASQQRQNTTFGRYTEVKVEKELIETTAKAKRSVLHFYHRDFRRCRIMDAHLEKLAAKHTDTLFLKADVANVPFLVAKLEVKVLPCVIGFVDGVTKMKLVGFDELPGGDTFQTASLEIGMVQCGTSSLSSCPCQSEPFFLTLFLSQACSTRSRARTLSACSRR
ncbi:uncharacterized protein RHOBADRAFT_10581, partial [Rhodotorula graminis WP1]